MAKVAKRSKAGNKRPKPASRVRRCKRQRSAAPLFSVPFALTCDGRVLINVTDIDKDRSLVGRETFTGAVITKAEIRKALRTVNDGFAEASSQVIAGLPVLRPKRKRARTKPAS